MSKMSKKCPKTKTKLRAGRLKKKCREFKLVLILCRSQHPTNSNQPWNLHHQICLNISKSYNEQQPTTFHNSSYVVLVWFQFVCVKNGCRQMSQTHLKSFRGHQQDLFQSISGVLLPIQGPQEGSETIFWPHFGILNNFPHFL